jgi:PleD family two-component response regulator
VEKTVVTFEGRIIPLTVSVGLVEGAVTGPEQRFGELLFGAADAAMYRAKNSGRNCFVVDSILQDEDGARSLERSRSMPHPEPALR